MIFFFAVLSADYFVGYSFFLDVIFRMARQTQAILQATQSAADTEQVGVDITDELGRNRAKIQGVQDKVLHFVINTFLFTLDV